MAKSEGVIVVYCVNCGTKNPDDAVTCTQCGRSIMRVERGRTWREEEMCFGMPSHWGGVLVGLFIIVIGLIFFFRQFVPMLTDIFWPLVLIFVGAAILLGGIYRYSRR
jgi:ribosomal protein L40E